MRPDGSLRCRGSSATISSEVAAAVCDWRNSLFCAATTLPLLYLALEDHILVYSHSDCHAKGILEPRLQLVNPAKQATPQRQYGPRPGPFDGKAINVLKTFMLSNQEILVSGDGLGRVIIRNVNSKGKLEMCFDVKSSIWGIDVQGRHLAVSANSHKIYLFDLEKPYYVDGSYTARSLPEYITLHGAQDNIPDLSLSSDLTALACVDIACNVNTWRISPVVSARALTLALPHQVGWGCQYLPRNAFRLVRTLRDSSHTANTPNPVRSRRPMLQWWKTVGANICRALEAHAADELSDKEQLLCLQFLEHGMSPDQIFESHWNTNDPELFTSFEFEESSRQTDDLLLVTTVDMILLIHSANPEIIHSICYYPFGAALATSDIHDRINMIRVLPTMGLVAVASQKGQACLLQLVKCVRELEQGTEASYSFKCVEVYPAQVSSATGELLGMDFFCVSATKAKLCMLFRDGLIKTIECERPIELDVSDLML